MWWAIAYEFDKEGNISEVYPARVKFRGFGEKNNTDGYVIVEVYNTAWQLDFQIVMNASKTLMVGQMSMDYSTGEMGLGPLGNDIKIDDDGTYLVGDLSDYFTL